jgi:hypothetical protein
MKTPEEFVKYWLDENRPFRWADAIADRDAEHAALHASDTAEIARLQAALTEIAEYDTDWTRGPAENVGILQGIAEGALAATTKGPPT